MKNLIVFFLLLSSTVATAATKYAVANGLWSSTTSVWATTRGGAAGANVPLQTDTVIIPNSITVTVDVDGQKCYKIIVESGGTLTCNASNIASGNQKDLRVYGIGTVVTNDGIFGTGTDGLNINLYYSTGSATVTFTGTQQIKLAKLTSNYNAMNVVLNSDMLITYQAGATNGGTGIVFEGSAVTKSISSLTINAGYTLSFGPYSRLCYGGSNSYESQMSHSITINGVVNTCSNSDFILYTGTGYTTTLTIGSTGQLNIGKNCYPTAPISGVSASIINIGIINAGTSGSGIIDFRSAIVTGAGSFNLLSGATLRIGGSLGLDPTNGPIRTTRTFPSTANYDYAGTGAQVTGSELPASVSNLYITNPSGVTLSQSVSVNALTMRKGNLALGANTLAYGTPGSLSYVDSSAQTTDDVVFPASGGPKALIVNKTSIVPANLGTLTLHASRSLSDGLTLTSGLLTLGTNNLTLGTAALVSGGSATSYVDVSGSGVFKRELAADGAYAFPIGNTGYSPVTLTFTSAGYSSASVDVDAFNAKHGSNTSSTDYIKRYWNVSATGISGGSYNADFVYTDGDTVGTETNLTLGQHDGLQWKVVGTVNPTTNTLSATGLTSFSDFTGGEAAALPVQLASFVGSYVGNNAKLEWSTVSEVNNYGFNVQRKSGSEFVTVGFVAGKGTTLEPQSYSFVDENESGVAEYRLEQIDNNGLKNYFGPIYLNPNSVDDKMVPAVFALNQNYPNPFNPTTNITFSLANSGYTTLKVYNILGNEVATLFNGNAEVGKLYSVKFDATKLSTGMYIYRLQNGNSVEVKKLTLVK
jgi:hypothetical protein